MIFNSLVKLCSAGACTLFLSYTIVLEAKAEDILLPNYNNEIYEDGYERWNRSQLLSKPFLLKSNFIFEQKRSNNKDIQILKSNYLLGRADRTSNHLPASYNITVKGYCLYEEIEERSQLWSFNKIDLNMSTKPSIFFGVQKPFR